MRDRLPGRPTRQHPDLTATKPTVAPSDDTAATDPGIRIVVLTLLAVDGVGAGVGDRVLIVLEGRAAGEALGRKAAPVDAAIVGIVDHLDIHAAD